MIVLDASVVVELLTNGPWADSLRRDLAGRSEPFIVPHLLDVEAVSALRGLVAGRRIDSHRSEQVLTELAALPRGPMRTRHWWAGFGNCGTTLPPTMPSTSPWLKQPAPSCTPATRNCAKAIARRWRSSAPLAFPSSAQERRSNDYDSFFREHSKLDRLFSVQTSNCRISVWAVRAEKRKTFRLSPGFGNVPSVTGFCFRFIMAR